MAKHGRNKVITAPRKLLDIPVVRTNNKLVIAQVAKEKEDKKDDKKDKTIKYTNVEEITGGKVILSKLVLKQLNYLSLKFPSNEWSGILVWDIVSGSMRNVSELIMKAQYVFPMDIGSGTYTEYENSPEMTLDLYEEYPDAETMRLGHVHSHNSMGVFFSVTDTDELHDNAGNHIAYLSVIVNNKREAVAKLAVVGNIEGQITSKIKDFDDTYIETSDVKQDKKLIIYTLSVLFEEDLTVIKTIESRITKIKDYIAEKTKKKEKEKGIYTAGYGQYGRNWENFEDDYLASYQQRLELEPTKEDLYEISWWTNIKTGLTEALLEKILEVNDLNYGTIKEVDLSPNHPLEYSNINTIVDAEITDAATQLVIKGDKMMTFQLQSSLVLELVVLRALKSRIVQFPEGRTKNILVTIFEELTLLYDESGATT